MFKTFSLSLIALAALSFSSAQASELSINPGLWKTTTTTSNSFMDQPQTLTTEECVTETSFNPEEMTEELGECELVRNDISDNTLTFGMTCSAEGNEVTVNGEYTAEDDTGHGTMDMNMSMQGMQMEINMQWTSERIGDC